MKVITDYKGDPMWDTVSQSSCDFRPHFDGNLINLSSCITPKSSIDETETIFIQCAQNIAKWVLENKNQFSPGDRFQIVVGWPTSTREYDRQVVKIGGDIEEISDIAKGCTNITLRDGWTELVFDK